MRLALVVASLRAGGTERVVATVGAALFHAGHRVVIVTESSAATDHYRLDPGLLRLALDVESATAMLWEKVTENLARVRRLRKAVLSVDAQAVIAFGETTSIRTLLACIGTRLPVIVAERSDPRRHRVPSIWNWLRRRLYKHAAAVVVQTESVARWARSMVAPNRIHVIPNPVRPRPQWNSRPEGLPSGNVIVAVGRFTAEKGFALLIEAFARSGLHARGWSLVILGEGPDRAALEARVREFDLDRSVSMPGLVAEPAQWLCHADLFVLPSLYEGFPNALLEAMTCGAAAIAFDCPSGPAEIIHQHRTGLLVPAGDLDGLANAMEHLAADPERRRTMAAAAEADVNLRFALHTIIKQWEEMLRSVTGTVPL